MKRHAEGVGGCELVLLELEGEQRELLLDGGVSLLVLFAEVGAVTLE